MAKDKKAAAKGKDKKAAAQAEEKSALQKTVEDLNEVCGFSPALDHTAKNIEEELKEVAGELKESDKLADESWQYLESIGALPEWKQPKKNTKNKNTEDDDMASKGKSSKSNKAAAAPAKGKTLPKKETKKAAPKDGVEQSCYGHRIGSGGAAMDAAIKAGGTIADVAKKCKVPEARVKAHIKHLASHHNISVTETKTGTLKVVKGD